MRKILAIIAVIGIGWNCAYGCVFISGAGDSNGIGCIKIGTACYTCGTYTAQCSSGCSSTVNITQPTFFSDITATFNYCNESSWSNLNKVIYQDSTADTSGGGMCAYTLISGSGACAQRTSSCGGTVLATHCKANFYRITSPNVKCEPCPTEYGVPGNSDGTSIDGISRCYLPSGSGYSDSYGLFSFTDKCPY